MSATLYALVVLQGTTLTFSPGYTTAAECLQQYKGPYVSCFPYDPERTTWTAFFKTPGSGFGSVWNFPNESVCQSYVGAFRPDVPAACRQLARSGILSRLLRSARAASGTHRINSPAEAARGDASARAKHKARPSKHRNQTQRPSSHSGRRQAIHESSRTHLG